jgi:hypothetical protein
MGKSKQVANHGKSQQQKDYEAKQAERKSGVANTTKSSSSSSKSSNTSKGTASTGQAGSKYDANGNAIVSGQKYVNGHPVDDKGHRLDLDTSGKTYTETKGNTKNTYDANGNLIGSEAAKQMNTYKSADGNTVSTVYGDSKSNKELQDQGYSQINSYGVFRDGDTTRQDSNYSYTKEGTEKDFYAPDYPGGESNDSRVSSPKNTSNTGGYTGNTGNTNNNGYTGNNGYSGNRNNQSQVSDYYNNSNRKSVMDYYNDWNGGSSPRYTGNVNTTPSRNGGINPNGMYSDGNPNTYASTGSTGSTAYTGKINTAPPKGSQNGYGGLTNAIGNQLQKTSNNSAGANAASLESAIGSQLQKQSTGSNDNINAYANRAQQGASNLSNGAVNRGTLQTRDQIAQRYGTVNANRSNTGNMQNPGQNNPVNQLDQILRSYNQNQVQIPSNGDYTNNMTNAINSMTDSAQRAYDLKLQMAIENQTNRLSNQKGVFENRYKEIADQLAQQGLEARQNNVGYNNTASFQGAKNLQGVRENMAAQGLFNSGDNISAQVGVNELLKQEILGIMGTSENRG